ncbi:MAG: hypothetical protein GY757_38520 [bacterium]|nr:hypothetical protein [bacterium]
MSHETLHKSSFDPYLNDTFEVHTESLGVVEVVLAEITENHYEGQESFSLLFRGSRDKIFEQKIQKLKHPEMGEFNLFLGPIVYEKQDGQYFQAVFSRLLKK